MYIPEFWCGVISVIVAEIILIVGAAVNAYLKKK